MYIYIYPQHQLISSNVKSKQPIVPAPSGFDMQSPRRWGVPMDPHGDSAGVWTLCTRPGERLHFAMENHHAINGKIMENPLFLWPSIPLLFVCSPGRVPQKKASSSIKCQAAAAKTSPLLCCCCRDSSSLQQLQRDQKAKRKSTILQRNDMAIPGWFAEAVPYGGMPPSVGKGKGWRRRTWLSLLTWPFVLTPNGGTELFSNSTSIYNNYILIILVYINIRD